MHDPFLKSLSNSHELGREGKWDILTCMNGWTSPKKPNSEHNFQLEWLKRINLCDLIASASDRTTIGRLPVEHSAIRYDQEGLQIHHLLSGKPQQVICDNWHDNLIAGKRQEFLEAIETEPLNAIKNWEDAQKVHWWLWRCYPQEIAKQNQNIHLLPAETRIPDASLWSHVSMTSAIAGGLAGYYKDASAYPQKGERWNNKSRPHVVTFSFSPVQELIKASRKMRDFWAGSWILHYLSAKVAWAIASKYGSDTLLYPCLYEQPLIDHWLLQKYPDFQQWIKPPSTHDILTAGFPNVLVMILPNNGEEEDNIKDNPVKSAMEYANNVLNEEWHNLGKKVLEFLQAREKEWQGREEEWQNINPHTWDDWLKAQWQIYWVSVPMGSPETEDLSMSPRPKVNKNIDENQLSPEDREYGKWIGLQNNYSNPNPELFLDAETDFLNAIFNLTQPKEGEEEKTGKYRYKQPNLNVGSWWASTFDQLRYSLNAVKNARNWQLPTAFASRSTISGLGSVVHPIVDQNKPDWATEGDTRKFWQKHLGVFDGIEELNATEVVKRCLHQILLSELGLSEEEKQSKIAVLYPDLSSGVAGYLKELESKGDNEAIKRYHDACKSIVNKFSWAKEGKDAPANLPWGIPWIAKHHPNWLNPRLLNAGWLIDDFESPSDDEKQAKEDRKQELRKLRTEISKYYSIGGNPTDWYILAAGDGDGMGEWLKGIKLKPYQNYIPEQLQDKIKNMPDKYRQPLEDFLTVDKRMGPSTHSALSRALLDFSNKLVPYLTEERYAGRLIYGGGDDVLAYTNLWEWDRWLWDIRQCFKGADDPHHEFISKGDYWQWGSNQTPSPCLSSRPLFTMGENASISFGITIAHHSVPMAIALENLWEAEESAKEHEFEQNGEKVAKDALQVRVIYGNGNVLKATAKFDLLPIWQELLNLDLTSSIFEVAGEYINNYPIPEQKAIAPWVKAFSERRANLTDEMQNNFQDKLSKFIEFMWETNDGIRFNKELSNWLKLTAFIIRSKNIKIVNKVT